MGQQHFDILIIGAGLSGIGSACHVSKECPDKSLAILERRQTMGGTWDLFRYPGIRSDSDMTSFGFQFKPWFSDKVLAKGPDIRNYVVETAAEYGIKDKVQFGLKITSANWNSSTQLWEIEALHEPTNETRSYTCNFFLNCTGYYNYDKGYRPHFNNEETFKGQIIHPQHWPEDLDYSGKKVVVIGSGATAVTIVPSMTDKASHVTMLQRSPTYIMSLPDNDKIASFMAKIMPKSWAYLITRKRNILIQRALYLVSMRWPNFMRKVLARNVRKELGENVDMKHFSPSYNPWEERLCAAPDGDFFAKIREGKASVVTDHIDSFTETGIKLKTGQHLDADIIVTATGLNVQMMGGLKLSVDGEETHLSDKMTYKSVMIEGVPNFSWVFGYINAPWTLKCDIASRYICRLIKFMDSNNYTVATPTDIGNNKLTDGMLDNFDPGYAQRAKHMLPRQGRSGPWKLDMDYGKDKKVLLKEPVDEPNMHFKTAAQKVKADPAPQVNAA
ncbi:FAD-containing monooxygenase EthA [Oleiphilus sp. HI0071]|uniref:flavin-containing monooxygenase n=1 Tax=unclassified Oleiphilus TaxID=2631174 RepID=UPI0007C215D8|nr:MULTISPECIES: NAD(P)/FAD-dependent oxidoreductase [unclassified Oleiphilus]KZY62311.1 FAD-containing monooxygenase EthA [Oleiphilus sp. HI0065]KZY85493.1 FAD-containing monooxygenase EthA [Oleiphilus sp. HI0071]KZY99737.1 FAD-containing monooxygenase EthA [Oleiphilus sp. HI0073]KZZ48134.1 FAD-containing monooxygenase EthA [Oleiphilus sp. HI0122]KZZ63690.1 FAD-containing monooxygenase EthA [Oleiphilus sp. HI0130]KZZ78550.1 FAD-containing monooxygenase EthA [Oleiphilus sp. HI0133]